MSRVSLLWSLIGVVLLILGSACGAPGGEDLTSSPSSATDALDSQLVDDSGSPWALAWRVSGPAGTSFTTSEALTANGGVQSQSGSHVIDADGEVSWLYTQFVDSVEVEFVVDSRGPAEASIVVARYVDPSGTDGEIEIGDVLVTVEVRDGESMTVSGSR